MVLILRKKVQSAFETSKVEVNDAFSACFNRLSNHLYNIIIIIF